MTMTERYEGFARQLDQVQEAYDVLVRAAERYREMCAGEMDREEAKPDANPKRAGLFHRAVLETEDLLGALDTRVIDGLVRMVDRLEMVRAAYEPGGMARIGMIVDGSEPAGRPLALEEGR